MKKLLLFFAIALSLLISCSGEKKSRAGRPRIIIDTTDLLAIDSVEYYETDFEVRQKDDKVKMIGKWNVKNMRRQQKAELENLSDVYIEFYEDSVFTGNAGCNKMRGIYTVKGSSVVFKHVLSTQRACNKMDQENAFLGLLENTVSAYTFNGNNKLLLRDGSSNIVFECKKTD